MLKKSRKCLPGPPARGPEKVSKKSRRQSGKSPQSLRKVSGECFPDFLETFSGFQARGPEKHFRDFVGMSGPENPRDPCKGRAGSRPKSPKVPGRVLGREPVKSDCWGDCWEECLSSDLPIKTVLPALLPADPPAVSTLPSTLPSTFGDLGFLSPVAGGPDLNPVHQNS